MRDMLPPLVWPRSLELPSERVTVVYLDLNHWIFLAQASVGHSQGRPFAKALEACRAAVSAGSAVFVLSQTHYIEMLKIKDWNQRKAVADIMEQLTHFSTLLNRSILMKLEFSTAVERFTKEQKHLPVMSLVGRGVFHCYGKPGGFKFVGPSGDATGEVRQRLGEKRFDDFVADALLLLERSSLRGPTDGELEHLRTLGWNPEAVIRVATERADEERAQSQRLDGEGGRWRRGRLRDVTAARELLIEFDQILRQELAINGLALSRLVSDVHSARALVRGMPSAEVAIELKTAWHRNRDKNWEANDIFDIDALSVAVPYCDVVVTEKACHHVLETSGLGKRMNTALLRNLNDLPNTLKQWQPRRNVSELNPS